MPILGDLIRYAIQNKQRKKAIEKFLAQFPEQEQPFPGKKVSELAAVLGGVGQNMPIPEHLGGNALPFSQTPTLRPDQMQQMTPPSLINPQNAQLAKAKALVRSGFEPGVEAGLNMLMPQAGKQHAPMQVAPGNAIVDPNTGGIIYQAPPNAQESNKVITLAPGAKAYDYDGREIASNSGKEDEVGVIAIDPTDGKRRFFRRSYAIDERLEAPEPSPGVTVNTGDMPAGTRKEIWSAKTDLSITKKNLLHTYGKWRPEWSFREVQGLEWAKGQVDRSAFLTAISKLALGPERHRQMMDEFQAYTDWSRGTQDTLNRHIRAFTGAQMNQYEIPRLLSAMATQKDGPEAYSAKVKSTIAMLDSMEEEYNRLLDSEDFKNGTLTLLEIQDIMARNIEAGLQQIQGPLPTEGSGIDRSW